MSTELTKSNRTFFQICEDLAVWQETLEFIEDRMRPAVRIPEQTEAERIELSHQRTEILAKREELGLELIAKVDGIAAVDRRFDAEIQLADEAAKSATKHRKALEASKAWLRDYVLNVMEQRGMKHLKTPLTTVTVQGNGGVAPVVIEDESKLPLNLCWNVGRIRSDVWEAIMLVIGSINQLTIHVDSFRFTREPNTAAISKALQEPCPECTGRGTQLNCVCRGTRLRQVPGARLAERGKHLRIT